MKIYVDLDGVLADLFNHVAYIHDVEHYNHLTKAEWELFFKNTDVYSLFRNLPVFGTANDLIQMVLAHVPEYYILSSPLSFDRENSIKGKTEWVKQNLLYQPAKEIYEHNKYIYAVDDVGPNILIDDYKVNIDKWRDAGGIGIKYQADEDDLSIINHKLKTLFNKKGNVAHDQLGVHN